MPTIAEYKEQIRLKKALKNNGILTLSNLTKPTITNDNFEEIIKQLYPIILKETIKNVLKEIVSAKEFYRIILENVLDNKHLT